MKEYQVTLDELLAGVQLNTTVLYRQNYYVKVVRSDIIGRRAT